jgi:hypothetical protein
MAVVITPAERCVVRWRPNRLFDPAFSPAPTNRCLLSTLDLRLSTFRLRRAKCRAKESRPTPSGSKPNFRVDGRAGGGNDLGQPASRRRP